MDKKVAILLATHNSERYLEEQLESLFNQTYGNIEIVVSDDASTDSTPELLGKYPSLTVIKSDVPLKSAKKNFMFLIKNAPQADYYMFCDHDDFWCASKVEITLNKMLEADNGLPTLVHTDLLVVDERLDCISNSLFAWQKISKEQTLAQTLIQNNVTGCTTMINEPLRALAAEMDETKSFIMHDWLLAVLASAVGNIAFVDTPTIKYRQHSGNAVGAKDAGSISYILGKVFDRKNSESLKNTYLQAQSVAECYGERLGRSYTTVSAYADFLRVGKLKRLLLCKRYGFYKNTLLRRIGQLIYM